MDTPDIGFQAGFGFYLGVVVVGVAAIAGLAADVSTATLLGVLPTALTVVTIAGHVIARRSHGLPERIGRSRWRRAACYVPPLAFAVTLFAATFELIDPGTRIYLVTVVFALLSAPAAYGIDRMSRNRYVEAATADEPVATWQYHPVGLLSGRTSFTVVVGLLIGLGILGALLGRLRALLWPVYGVVMLVSTRLGRRNAADSSGRWNVPTLRAHRAGLVVQRPFARTLLPWDAIEDVRLTDDELVLERRRRFDLHCDRDPIDDPEAVCEAIERTRAGTVDPIGASSSV